MNMSSWNSKKLKRRNPAFSSGHVIVEFNRTKKQRIVAHKLGQISFESRDINPQRDTVIARSIDTLGTNGFVYKNVGHTYLKSQIVPITSAKEFPVYAHGHPLGGLKAGMESCSREGLVCAEGQGSDRVCNPGKCVIGTLRHVRNKKWRYESSNKYEVEKSTGGERLPFVQYLTGESELSLKSLRRGRVVSFSDSSAVTLRIDKPASVGIKVYLPPEYYFSKDFIDQAIEVFYEVLGDKSNYLIGVEDRKDRFIQAFMLSLYDGKSEGFISSVLYEKGIREEIRDQMVKTFSTLPSEWSKQIVSIIDSKYSNKGVRGYTNLDFISDVYDSISLIFTSVIQIAGSSVKSSKIDYQKTDIARPIYSRLPGVSESYRSDPLFSEKETPAQWLTSGADEFLSKKKDQISSFYEDYLDPETCSPFVLDWLAQHVGLTGPLWNSQWPREIKKVLIENAFGWYDRELREFIPGVGDVLTPKGEALSKFPFNSDVWVEEKDQNEWGGILSWNTNIQWDGEVSNLTYLKLDEVEKIKISGSTEIVSGKTFTLKSYLPTEEKVSLIEVDTPKVDKKFWNGLIESKGSLISSIFLCSLFGLKSHSPLELEIVDLDNKVIKPKQGLRNTEVDSPILMPYKQEVLQVGDIKDLETNNYSNQFIAGVSRVASIEASKNVFFRVPYYYNRDGKSWDRVNYIAKNWLPDNLNKRVQYPYLSAGLWAVGDGFFEPEIVDESIYETSLILTEENEYLTTEDGSPLNFI